MSQPLSEQTIALVKATVPALEAHGLAIVREMYDRLFQNPDIAALFNQSHHGGSGSQSRALTGAILSYASNVENLAALAPAVERIAQKHVGLQIVPEHYPFVADALLGAIKAVLGDAATDDILAAWGEAYWFLANILIAREERLYTDQRTAEGGWNGWREFEVAEVAPESAVITSFTLRPADGEPVMAHRPGQYLTFSFDIPGHAPVKRNYSISAAPNGESYRISVKREPQGLASGWLHDNAGVGTRFKVAAPSGEFFLDAVTERPVVLLSGGVGLTPLVAMLEALVAKGGAVPIHYVHGTHDRTTHAMRDHVRALAAKASSVSITDFHQQPLPDEVPGRDYDIAGIITDEWLLAHTPVAEADYYICGPRAFLRHAVATLSQAGVAASRIHYEFFGPADELLAA
ncbi:NO-inducible flavohemoprotein [Altererythrobacter sp. FM1]|uniref:nitric oxide dioxygenase n=1 Tax=Tsuneonella flava TaxID=2055955 RepID=A0ABX7KCB7_9SPHN|nr:NO-inducible flavohemoprotein [Tsuneonella flava]QSB45508.1 NO-inducible flavohemoprotein [Tsuneonella flava]ROT97103.1 NO-inducible flavohemoprotein [Altererythrobacter sp. FM1]